MKLIKRILWFIIALVLFFATAITFIFYFQGDTIKDTLLQNLNKQMKTELYVEDVELEFFKYFPKGSLTFKNVSSTETTKAKGGQLLKAETIAIFFDLENIFDKKFTIDGVSIHDAYLNLHVYPNGEVNYNILEIQTGSKSDFNIELKKISLNNVVVSYINEPSVQEYLFTIVEGEIDGNFAGETREINFKGNINSTHLKSGKHVLLQEKFLGLEFNLEHQPEDKKYTLSTGRVKLGDINLNVEGSLWPDISQRKLDLSFSTEKVSIQSVLNEIPSTFLQPISGYKLSGSGTFDASLKGSFSNNHLPELLINFTLQNASLENETSEFKLSKINTSGSFEAKALRDPKSFILKLKQTEALLESGTLKGSLVIDNFIRPFVNVSMLSNIDFEKLSQIFIPDQLKQLSGSMELDINFKKRLKDFRKFTINDFVNSQTSGGLKVNDLAFKIDDFDHDFQKLNGSFKFSNRDLVIEQFEGKVNNSDFEMEGDFGNLLAFVFIPGERLFVKASMQSDHLLLDELLPDNSSSNANSGELHFNQQLAFDLQVAINHFSFRKFKAQHLHGRFTLQNNVFRVFDGSLKSMDGLVNVNGKIDGTSKEYQISCFAGFQAVNIRNLFESFNNFGQSNLTASHLNGSLNAQVTYQSNLTPKLTVDPTSVYTLASINVSDGELINWEPLQKLSRFAEADELTHVRFSSLNNTIEIDEEKITIPQMTIQSNTLDLDLKGIHNFDNTIDYHVQMLVSDLVGKKDQNKETIDGNFVKEDGVGNPRLYIRMTGNAADPSIKYDTPEVQQKIAKELSKEKDKLKNMFSGKDNPTNKTVEPGKDFVVDWETSSDSTLNLPANKKEKPGKPKEQHFIIEWDEKGDTIPD